MQDSTAYPHGRIPALQIATWASLWAGGRGLGRNRL